MGAAKRRGSFEQRQKAAYDRIDAETQLIQQAHENTLELERLERESQRRHAIRRTPREGGRSGRSR